MQSTSENGAGGGRPSVAIVGGGMSGIGALVMLHRAGYEGATVFEKDERIGGVWHRNAYPGAQCDVPSHFYEFSFEPNPRWSQRFAPQAEIQRYFEDIVRREGITDRIRTGTEVKSAAWDARGKWVLELAEGTHEADVLIAACGQLSTPAVPAIPGLDSFEGPSFHTARWPEGLEHEGRRVAVVGTGCSAIQVVPAIQPEVEHLDVYQRTPGWTVPKGNRPYRDWQKRLFERFPAIQRANRKMIFNFHNLGAAAMTGKKWLMPPFRMVGRRQIRKAITDPELRAKVMPTDEFGCKRVMLTDEWYPALTKPNVNLITDAITEITPTGIRTADGAVRETDILVLATGFASHDFVAPLEVTGAAGRSLREEWSPVPRAYLGLSVPDFPNMFLLYGPNTNGGTGSVFHVTEAGMRHVIAALDALRRKGARKIEVRRETADRFDTELRAALTDTVWHTGCTSWYVDEQGNDPNQWPWLWSTYAERTAELEPGAYEVA